MKVTFVTVACLFVSVAVSFGADTTDPFVGKWVLNESASKFPPRYEHVEAMGNNKFQIGDGKYVSVVVADGTDQTTKYGLTVAITNVKRDGWHLVWKTDGKVNDEETWSVDPSGRTMSIVSTYHVPGVPSTPSKKTFTRVTGNTGIEGKWQLTAPLSEGIFHEQEIKLYESDGLSFLTPTGEVMSKVKFDGKDYPSAYPPGSTSSGTRQSSHALKTIDKKNGKVIGQDEQKVSADSNTLTVITHNPDAVLVYNRVDAFPTK